MFEAYSNTETAYTLNELVELNSVRYQDCRVSVTNGSTFTINTPGRYYIYFGGTASSATAAAPFTVQLVSNDEVVPAVSSTITSTAANDRQNLSFSTIVNVMPSNCYIDNTKRLQIRVTSTDAGTIYNANLVIFRLK